MRAAPMNNRSPHGHIQQVQRAQTENLSKKRGADNLHLRPLPRAMTSYTEPPRMSYCPRSAQDNSNTLSQLSNIIYSVAMGLAPKLTRFPGFCKNPNGECQSIREIQPQFEDYEAAFNAERGHRHSKPSAIAAVLSTYVWDTIQEYRIFTEEAAQDLKVLAKLSEHPDPVHSQDELDEEVYAARMVHLHGAGQELKPGSPAEKKVSKEMRFLYKHLFKDQNDAEGKRLICVELGKHVWDYAMELKNQKGRIAITFDPKSTTSRYKQELRQGGLQISYFEAPRHTNQQDSTGRRSAPPVLWFPEVTLYRRRFDERETAVIFHAKYSRDLGKLIERAEYVEQLLGGCNPRDSPKVSEPGLKSGYEVIERKRTLSLGAMVAASRGAPTRDSYHSGNTGEEDHLPNLNIAPIPSSRGTDTTLVVPDPARLKITEREKPDVIRPGPTRGRAHVVEKAQAAVGATGRTHNEGIAQGGIFSWVIKLFMNLFRKRPAPTSPNRR